METKVITNPYGANGETSDPREQVMWDLYVTSINKGQENACQAALDAGYSKASAEQITTRVWFTERLQKLKRKTLVSKAEKVFEKTLDYDTRYYTDKEGNEIMDTSLLKAQIDAAKFVAGTQGKEEGYGSLPAVNDNNIVMIVLNK